MKKAGTLGYYHAKQNTLYWKKKIIDKVLFEIKLLISSRRILLETNFEFRLLNCVIPALLAGKYGDDLLSKCNIGYQYQIYCPSRWPRKRVKEGSENLLS